MSFISGILFNLKGLWLGIRTPRLLFLGLVRLLAVVVLTAVFAGFILAYHAEIVTQVWARPESLWVLWAWHVVSWLLSFLLVALSGVLSYLLAQILFSVIIMDLMSRITERIVTGKAQDPPGISTFKLLAFLVLQEIPRAILPVLLTLFVMVLGWFTPLGPFISVVLPVVAVVFLAWDNTDIIPARRLDPFRKRFDNLKRNLPFHLGFGLLFLVPVLNILLLCFAPVGATLYMIEKEKKE